MNSYKSPYIRYIEAMEKTGDIMLAYWYQRQQFMDELLSDKQLDLIADRVIERIHLTADASEIIEAIEEIQKKLKDLGVE